MSLGRGKVLFGGSVGNSHKKGKVSGSNRYPALIKWTVCGIYRFVLRIGDKEHEKGRTMKERIRQIRKHLHLTQKDIAKAIGATAGFVSLVETGRSGMSDENTEALCKAFHIRAEWVINGSGTMESENPEDWVVRPKTNDLRKQEEIAQRIVQVRRQVHMNQHDFGESIGYSREMIALVEQHRRSASETLLQRIEDRYGVSHSWLTEGQGEVFVNEPPHNLPKKPANRSGKKTDSPEQYSDGKQGGNIEEDYRIIRAFFDRQPELRHAVAEVLAELLHL